MLEYIAARCRGEKERGGLLLGYYRGHHIEVTGFTQPFPDDRSELYRFVRQDDRHERVAKKAWRDSKETVTNIGEWHSHPHGYPAPSRIDSENWRTQAKEQMRNMAFVIVAPKQWAAYLVDKSGWRLSVIALEKEEVGNHGLIFSHKG